MAEPRAIPDDIRVFWINYYECWAGRSLEECIAASMKEFGVSREDAYDDSEAHEIPRDEWDGTQIPNDPDERIEYLPRNQWKNRNVAEIDWSRTPHCSLRELVADCDHYPAYIGGRE